MVHIHGAHLYSMFMEHIHEAYPYDTF